ncbi:hypothetical protein Cgig2_011191 [Carnegiea gigantea]|uniref:Uncharacterized protein n=1 Tax=Carnegiea gigantea TaxID=171969 RepID=A0A9Q1KF99_9CARY|nr:hypothetical protein Cgig2_011191 [Carnegiea gigantea]
MADVSKETGELLRTNGSNAEYGIVQHAEHNRKPEPVHRTSGRYIDRFGGSNHGWGTRKKYGTRVVNFTSLETLYVLEQCMPDLSDSDCDQCLKIAIGQMVEVRQVGRILQPSCNVRYEIYPFIGATSISSPPPSTTTNRSTGAGSETGDGGETGKFTITNNCSHTVWPAFSSACNGTMFSLQTQQSRVVHLPPGPTFQIWARTGCTNSTAGNFTCQTGDCKVNCSGNGFPPATNLAEFGLNQYDDLDYYDVSLVNGYNVAVAVVPQGGNGSNCAVIGCIYDIDGACPEELKLGGACQSPCNAFNNSLYCCTSNDLSPVMCPPMVYSTLFEKACPRAYYSHALDGDTRTFRCGGSPAFTVTFCPSSPTLIRSMNQTNYALNKETILDSLFSFWWQTCATKLRKPLPEYMKCTVEINEISTMESLQFDINTIGAATHNFSIDDKLGEGGFGEVYKGKLASGQEVAVKRLLQNSKQGVIEFKTEVLLLAKLQHKNLVKLLGFCVTSKEKILVYEFLPNSSVDRFLFDRTSSASMDWQTRLNIIVGVARGLMYLHEDSRLKVIHRDLKTSNILLDDSMNPNISDFGLAKLFGEGQTQGDTKRIVGTYGYMAPEYAIIDRYSVKSDVYSFGVIVLEIISGQKNRFFGGLQGDEALLHQTWRLWNAGKALDLVDTTLNEDFSHEEVIRCYQIGLLCIQEDAIQRPRMRWILDALSRPSIGLSEPTAPRFFGNAVKPDQGHHTYTGTETITDLYPRD